MSPLPHSVDVCELIVCKHTAMTCDEQIIVYVDVYRGGSCVAFSKEPQPGSRQTTVGNVWHQLLFRLPIKVTRPHSALTVCWWHIDTGVPCLSFLRNLSDALC